MTSNRLFDKGNDNLHVSNIEVCVSIITIVKFVACAYHFLFCCSIVGNRNESSRNNQNILRFIKSKRFSMLKVAVWGTRNVKINFKHMHFHFNIYVFAVILVSVSLSVLGLLFCKLIYVLVIVMSMFYLTMNEGKV